jgi:hypothetical protein
VHSDVSELQRKAIVTVGERCGRCICMHGVTERVCREEAIVSAPYVQMWRGLKVSREATASVGRCLRADMAGAVALDALALP